MERIKQFLQEVTVVDTETTNFKPEESTTEIVEVASGRFDSRDWVIDEQLIKPVRDIPPEASAIHFISNRMVRGQPTFDKQLDRIDEVLQLDKTSYMVAHHADFDRMVLQSAYSKSLEPERFNNFVNKNKWICTLRIARRLIGNDMDKLNLSYLRYRLDLDVPDDLPAHRAGADVLTCGRLLEKLIELAVEDKKLFLDEDIGEQLISLSWDTIKTDTWPFGKHKGKKLTDIPTDYYIWALENMDCLNEKNSNYDSDLAESIADVLEARL